MEKGQECERWREYFKQPLNIKNKTETRLTNVGMNRSDYRRVDDGGDKIEEEVCKALK